MVALFASCFFFRDFSEELSRDGIVYHDNYVQMVVFFTFILSYRSNDKNIILLKENMECHSPFPAGSFPVHIWDHLRFGIICVAIWGSFAAGDHLWCCTLTFRLAEVIFRHIVQNVILICAFGNVVFQIVGS